MAELKPCPFCGGEAKIINYPVYIAHKQYSPETADRKYYAQCLTCNTQQGTNAHETDEQAVIAWNTRATEPEAQNHVPTKGELLLELASKDADIARLNGELSKHRSAEPEARALTVEELRLRNTCEPLFIKLLPPCHAEKWEIPLCIVQGTERLICKGNMEYFICDYGKTWLAFDRQPKGE